MRPKKEPVEEEEWHGPKEAEELSFNTIQPAADDVAEDWSLRETTAAQLEIQRQILAEVERAKAQQQQAAANAARRRVPPPPQPKEVDYIVLDPYSDDEREFQRALQQTRWGGDTGAGPSMHCGDLGTGTSKVHRDDWMGGDWKPRPQVPD